MSSESMMPSNHLILCCSLLLMLSIFSRIRVFSDELTVHFRWPDYWRVSFSISPFKEYSGLSLDWLLDWLVWSCSPRDCQESSPAPSILWCSAFFCTSLEAQLGFPGGSEVKASAGNAGDLGSIPGSGRSPGEANGNPLQYSCLENPMEGGPW